MIKKITEIVRSAFAGTPRISYDGFVLENLLATHKTPVAALTHILITGSYQHMYMHDLNKLMLLAWAEQNHILLHLED